MKHEFHTYMKHEFTCLPHPVPPSSLFYILMMKDLKEKLRKQSHLPLKRIKYLGINLPKERKDL